jgi:hypothetical protein
MIQIDNPKFDTLLATATQDFKNYQELPTPASGVQYIASLHALDLFTRSYPKDHKLRQIADVFTLIGIMKAVSNINDERRRVQGGA